MISKSQLIIKSTQHDLEISINYQVCFMKNYFTRFSFDTIIDWRRIKNFHENLKWRVLQR